MSRSGKAPHEIEVPAAGNVRPLYRSPGRSWCGPISDGVSFRFDGDGCWVVSLETLRQIVAEEDAARAQRATQEST
jgi:hypothetical protein